jgi:hypothetical protein
VEGAYERKSAPCTDGVSSLLQKKTVVGAELDD